MSRGNFITKSESGTTFWMKHLFLEGVFCKQDRDAAQIFSFMPNITIQIFTASGTWDYLLLFSLK